jgi:adenylylsulfate kinase
LCGCRAGAVVSAQLTEIKVRKREEAEQLADPKSKNLTWHDGQVARTEREAMLGQRGCTIWLTGLSGSGKSTLAVAAEKALHDLGKQTYILDGDNIRQGLNSNLGFSPEDRTENIRRIGEVSKLFTDAGVIVFTSFISPYRADRDQVREIMSEGDFIECFISASLETCEGRDVKGLYKKARKGEIPEFTGISAPYEEPEKPELVIDTGGQPVDASVAELIAYLQKQGYLSA